MSNHFRIIPESLQTVAITFGNETFQVNPTVFEWSSKKFARLYQSHEQICITENVSIEAVRAFISGCQGQDFPITEDISLDLELLSVNWEVESLLSLVRQFNLDPSRSKALLFPLLTSAIARNQETSAMERRLSESLLDHISDDRLLDLPFAILNRVIACHVQGGELSDGIFTFLNRALEKFGAPASLLFSSISIGQMTPRHLSILCASPCFVWSYVQGAVAGAVVDLAAAHARLEQTMLSRVSALDRVDGDRQEIAAELRELRAMNASQQRALEEQGRLITRLEQQIADDAATRTRIAAEHAELKAQIAANGAATEKERKDQAAAVALMTQKLAELNQKFTKSETDRRQLVCTYASCHQGEVLQLWYRCQTCGLTGNLGCCDACVKECHRGHAVEFVGIVPGFCDCGSRGSAKCRCIPHP
jgi:hypothetical protein